MESSSILPSPQGERFFYPPSWEFKVSPRQDVRSDKVTCKLLISTGKTVLVNRLFDHDLPTQYCKFIVNHSGTILMHLPIRNSVLSSGMGPSTFEST